jgi:hypothetical protein
MVTRPTVACLLIAYEELVLYGYGFYLFPLVYVYLSAACGKYFYLMHLVHIDM